MDAEPEATKRWILPRLLLGLGEAIIFLFAWFWLAGGWDWWPGWIFFGAFIIFISLLAIRMAVRDPALLRERNQPGENVEGWDRALMAIYSGLMLVMLALAALDSGRFGWSQVPTWLTVLGWTLIAITGAIVWHVMTVNPFLSGYARLQPERGQVVVSRGLYGLIRHPMYLGIILGIPGIPLVLGSLWSLIPALMVSALEVYRTAREDQMLQEGLPGYPDYSQEVRWRLIPGIW